MRVALIAVAATLAVSCGGPQPAAVSVTGLADIALTDVSREDLADRAQVRRWGVRVLYPACENTGPAAYAAPELTAALAAEDYFGQSEEMLATWRNRKIGQADAAPCGGAYPLATISIGLGVSGVNYTLLAEKLVERGFVAAIIDHPYGATAMLPGGNILSAEQDEAMGRIDEDPAILSRRTSEWVSDISKTITALTRENALAGLDVDSDRVFAIGHSMGGTAALDACQVDERLTACVDMDGAPFGSRFMEQGLSGDSLVLFSNPLYTDEDLAVRGRTRAAWDAMGGQIKTHWDEIIAKTGAPVVRVSVAGTGHMSFSDAPVMMPETISRFGGAPMEGEKALEIIAGVLAAYMESAGPAGDGFPDYVTNIPELEEIR